MRGSDSNQECFVARKVEKQYVEKKRPRLPPKRLVGTKGRLGDRREVDRQGDMADRQTDRLAD